MQSKNSCVFFLLPVLTVQNFHKKIYPQIKSEFIDKNKVLIEFDIMHFLLIWQRLMLKN